MAARMARLVLFVVLCLAAAVGRAAAGGELVMFHSSSCPWCAAWDREIGPVYDRTAEGRTLPLRRIDADRETTGGVRLRTPVEYTPTFVVVACGRELGRITGYPGEDHFWGLLGVEIERNRAALAAAC